MTLFVIDASVAMKWIFDEEQTEQANAFLIPNNTLIAPDFLLLECTNAIYKKVRNNEITTLEGDEGLQLLLDFGELKYVHSYFFLKRAYQFSRQLNHPVYDCLYLAIAEIYKAKVVTADKQFYKCTQKSTFSSLMHWVEDPT